MSHQCDEYRCRHESENPEASKRNDGFHNFEFYQEFRSPKTENH